MSTLTTIPPEILLQIISYLPHSASLYALSHASRSLAAFLHTHAATICNTRILGNYAHAAAILKSEFKDGWLVPTHFCIMLAEDRYMLSRGTVSPPTLHPTIRERLSINLCRRCGNMRGFCFLPNSDPDASDEPHYDPDLQSNSDRPPQTTTTQPTPHYNPHHHDLALALDLGLKIKLSRPGPQYLAFLEKYSWEIETRHSMARSSGPDHNLTPTPDTITLLRVAFSEYEIDTTGFDFMVGNYCVKPFLQSCDDTIQNYFVFTPLLAKAKKVRTRDWLDRGAKVLRTGKEQVMTAIKQKLQLGKTKTKRRMMFGEIESHEEEKSGLVVPNDNWVKGLLWFYGVSGRLAAAEEVSPGAKEEVPKPKKIRNCIAVFKRKTKKLGPSLRRAWRTLRCEGDFVILED